jgi:hypothetical protein
MADPIGIASFPGISQVVRCGYVLSHGISPGAAILEIAPQRTFAAEGGTLAFHFAGRTIAFPGCKIDKASFNRNESGLVWALQIYDRRWRWQFGEISGRYNLRRADGTLDADTEKSPRELAVLLLTAMGERNYDVHELPNDMRPEVEWVATNPAQALAELAEIGGCRVVLRLDNSVALKRWGHGAELPYPPIVMDDSGTIDPPERPDSLKLVGGPVRFQAAMNLEALGLDVDGSVKEIDKLSYKPASGWSGQVVGFFLNVATSNIAYPGVNPRELAKRTVFKWYGVKNFLDNTLNVPGYGAIKGRAQILPLEDEQIDTYADADGTNRSRPAQVWGVYWNEGLRAVNGTAANTAAGTYYTKPFRILRDKGIVEFDDYVFRWEANNKSAAATLALQTSFAVLDADTKAPVRFEKTYRFPGVQYGTGPRILRHDELTLTRAARYTSAGKLLRVDSNLADVNREADHYLTAAALEYQTPRSRDITYAGLLPINPDGSIQQVSWSVAQGEGAITRASHNTEYSTTVPSFKERRMLERLRDDRLRQAVRVVQRIQADVELRALIRRTQT